LDPPPDPKLLPPFDPLEFAGLQFPFLSDPSTDLSPTSPSHEEYSFLNSDLFLGGELFLPHNPGM